MREQIIVGAGLSGMVAAINLAREGFKVRVRERRQSIGGLTDIEGLEGRVINIGDGTPINLERLAAYTGIDISPVAVPLKECRNHVYGKTVDLAFYEGVPTYLVERGPRPSSLDVFLYDLAVAEGVEFTFNDTVTDFSDLPPDSIVATGLFGEAWPALGVPHMQVFGYLAMSKTDEPDAKVILYFDEYTRDYAFYSQVNGARGACLFSRGRPLDVSVKDRFERQLAENDGIVFEGWDAVSIGALPVLSSRNPRLFAKNFILAGTLSGTIDPLLLFGVHGGLVSGKIAAMAVTDHQAALEEFNRINEYFRLGFLLSTLYRTVPIWMLKQMTWAGLRLYPVMAPLAGERAFRLLPGYGRL
ncbi:MAG: NAD(P)-binding protein [Actinomycetota bacterium]